MMISALCLKLNENNNNKKKRTHTFKKQFFVRGMKTIIPDSRYSSSFKKNPREKAKADTRKIRSQSSRKIRKRTGHK